MFGVYQDLPYLCTDFVFLKYGKRNLYCPLAHSE